MRCVSLQRKSEVNNDSNSSLKKNELQLLRTYCPYRTKLKCETDSIGKRLRELIMTLSHGRWQTMSNIAHASTEFEGIGGHQLAAL